MKPSEGAALHTGCSVGILDDDEVQGRWPLLPQLGITHVEPGIGPIGADGKRILDVATAVREAGLLVRTVHANFGQHLSISSPDVGTRAEGIKAVREAIDACVAFGGEIVVVHCGDKLVDGQTTAEVRQLSIASVTELVEYAAPRNVKLALENLPTGYVTSSGSELMDIVTAFPAENVGVCFDSGHAHTTGEDAAIVDKIGERIITVHLHDNDGSGDQHLLPWEGTIDWSEVAGALGRNGYRELLMFEVSGPGGPEQAIPRLASVAERIQRIIEGGISES